LKNHENNTSSPELQIEESPTISSNSEEKMSEVRELNKKNELAISTFDGQPARVKEIQKSKVKDQNVMQNSK